MGGHGDQSLPALEHRPPLITGDGRHAAAARDASKIADFGCGIGTYLPMLSRLFDELSGFEQSPKYVDIARTNHRARKNVSVEVAQSSRPHHAQSLRCRALRQRRRITRPRELHDARPWDGLALARR